MTDDEPLSEFRSRAEHATDSRARGLLAAIVIALIALVTLIMLLAADTSRPSAVSHSHVEHSTEMPARKVETPELTNEESHALTSTRPLPRAPFLISKSVWKIA